MTRSRLLLPWPAARRAALLGALALAAASVPATADAAPQAAPGGGGGDSARVRELFKKGREEYAHDRLPQAYALFIEAWGLQRSFDIAGNLALVENQLTRYREAAEHATYALANFPAGGTDAQRRGLQEVLANARSYVGALTLRVNVDPASVTLDGQPLKMGVAPFAAEIFVDPGPHTLVAVAPDCEPTRDFFRAEKGSSHLITLTLVKRGTAGSKRPPIVEPPGEQPGPRPITVAGFITTGVGLGLGAAFAILAKIKADDANTLSMGLGANACAAPSPPSNCRPLHDALASHDTFANAAIWTFVAAGAVGAGTLIYSFVVPRAAPPVKAGRPQVIPVAGPGAGALVVKGAF